MDALTLLRSVSDAYRAITTLEVEAVSINESGDEDASSRSEHRVRFFYAAPNRMHYKPLGRNAMVQIADGTHLHTVFSRPLIFSERRRQISSFPVSELRFLPHVFRPELPLSNDDTFLFQGIEERVADARILREEDGCYVVAVTYEPSSTYPGFLISGDILFWVNASTFMVMKQHGELGHRFPADEEVTWTRLTISVRNIRLNEPLPEETFQFAPPPDVIDTTGRCGVSMSSGSGFIENGPDELGRIEHRSSHEWEGDTLVEHSKWKIRGMTLMFERRLTFSEDERELQIAERIKSPRGETEGSFKVPVK